jgi:hypothetical protein
MATAEPDYFCHKCQEHIGNVTVKYLFENLLIIIKDFLFRISNVHVVEKVL